MRFPARQRTELLLPSSPGKHWASAPPCRPERPPITCETPPDYVSYVHGVFAPRSPPYNKIRRALLTTAVRDNLWDGPRALLTLRRVSTSLWVVLYWVTYAT